VRFSWHKLAFHIHLGTVLCKYLECFLGWETHADLLQDMKGSGANLFELLGVQYLEVNLGPNGCNVVQVELLINALL
jgi:hypothetical protein